MADGALCVPQVTALSPAVPPRHRLCPLVPRDGTLPSCCCPQATVPAFTHPPCLSCPPKDCHPPCPQRSASLPLPFPSSPVSPKPLMSPCPQRHSPPWSCATPGAPCPAGVPWMSPCPLSLATWPRGRGRSGSGCSESPSPASCLSSPSAREEGTPCSCPEPGTALGAPTQSPASPGMAPPLCPGIPVPRDSCHLRDPCPQSVPSPWIPVPRVSPSRQRDTSS